MATRVFVEGTQRGYAVGTRDKKGTIREEYFHDNGTDASIDSAYRRASQAAASISSTIKLKPSLARRNGWLRKRKSKQ